MNKRHKGRRLELYISEKLKEAGDAIARPTRASGASTEIGDVYSSKFFVECKNYNKKNINIPLNVITHLKKQIPFNTEKEWFWAFRNKDKQTFIILEAEGFFRLIKKESYEKK